MEIRAKYLGNSSGANDLIDAAREIRDYAVQEAVHLLRNTRRSIAEKARSVRTRARRNGLRHAESEFQIHRVKRLLELSTRYQALVKQANHECLELAIAVAGEIIGTSVKIDTESLSQRIASTLDTTLADRSITLNVHPDALVQITSQLGRYQDSHHLKIVGDSSIAHGDAVIESAMGKILVSWRETLAAIADHLAMQIQRQSDREEGCEN